MPHGAVMEYNQITPEIFLGTNMCCSTHFKKLRKAGIDADLSLQKEPHENPLDLEYYLLLPVTDTYAPSIDQLRVGNRFIRGVIRNCGKVYVHCQLGHGRSPTMVAAYLMAEKGFSVEEAIMIIAEKRPEVHINQRQRTALEKFKAALVDY